MLDFIRQNFDVQNVTVTVPTLNLTEAYPGIPADFLDALDGLKLRSTDPGSPLAELDLRDLVDGDLTLTLDEILAIMAESQGGKIQIPIGEALDFMDGVDDLPYSLAHNYTVIDSFQLANGKFGGTLGNVALIDCHHANELLLTTYLQIFELIMER